VPIGVDAGLMSMDWVDMGPIGLAGIMGGDSTKAETDSRNIFLESAFFFPDAIAGRARRFYRLLPAGLRALNDARAAADNIWSGLTWPLIKARSTA